MNKLKKPLVIAVVIGFVAGVFWLAAIRFIAYVPSSTHHHANFALYIGGQREEFDNFTFYEEVESCGSDEVNNPKTRVHMHEQKNSVVHVHDDAATWAHFFANLGFNLGSKLVQTDKGIFLDGQDGNQLTFVLNGEKVSNPTNLAVRSEDTLLVNYGKDDQATVDGRYSQIVRDAGEQNRRHDPSGCAGSKPLTFMERVKNAFGTNN